MLRIAITGGIGTGKTTVCKIFETLQVPVLYADAVAKKVMHTTENIQRISEIFGEACYVNNKLQSKVLAAKVFNNAAMLETLNNIVHPLVHTQMELWFAQQTAPYALYESALIIETKSTHKVDKIIGVQSPLDIRISRIMERNKISKEAVENIIKKQLAENEKEKMYDFTIINDERQALIPQVMQLHETLLKIG